MQNYFENEITRMEKEILWLKTSAIKSGSVITSQVKTIDYAIPLELVSEFNATGSIDYKLILDDEAIFNTTLDKYYDDIVGGYDDGRRRAIGENYLGRNEYIITVYAWGDQNDRDILRGGGSVTITGKLTITCTDDFTIGVA